MDGIVLAAAGKKGGKKKGISAISAFQMLDVEEPDMSEVRETLLGFDFTVICLFFCAICLVLSTHHWSLFNSCDELYSCVDDISK